MKRALLLMLVALPFVAITQVVSERNGTTVFLKQVPNGVAARVAAVDPNAVYSNVTNFTGNTFNNGGSAVVAGNTITRLVADQLTLAGTPPYAITGFRFSITNNNSVAVTVRPRIRFYADNGGVPGVAIGAFSFAPITLQPNNTTIIESGAISSFVVPTQSVWAGVAFDNSGGTTGATQAQLDLIGQGIFNPIDRGTSSDNYFISSAPGDLGDNPSGTVQNFGGTPPANFGWELITAIPFPIVIEYFKGTKASNGNIIEWKINCSNTPGANLSIERSTDGRRFTSVFSINVTAAQCTQPFGFTDRDAVAGTNYYRLKSTDADGKILYSKVISLLNKQKGFEITGITPNPVSNGIAILNIASAEKSRVQVLVTGLNGSRVLIRSVDVIAGSNQVEFNFSTLAKGSYQVTVVGDDGEKKVTRFIKN